MSLSICVGSTDQDLTTTSALKLVLGTTSTATDAYLSTLIRSASKWAENYIGVPLTAQSYSETIAGFGRLQLMANRTPLRAVDRVLDATDSGNANQIYTSQFQLADADAGLLTREEGWQWNPRFAAHGFDAALPLSLVPMSGQEVKTFLVDYRAGFVYGGMTTDSANWSTEKGTTSTGRTLPEDIELAVVWRAQVMYQNRGQGEVTSESLDDLSVNYRSLGTDAASGDAMTGSKDLLAPYRRFV